MALALQAITSIITIIIAWLALGAWKRALIGQKRYEVAEEVLSTMYECREMFRSIRSDLSASTEGATRPRDEDESPHMAQHLDPYFIPIERRKAVAGAFSRLYALRFRCRAVLGTAFDAVEEFRKADMEYIAAAKHRYRMVRDLQSHPEMEHEHRDALEKLELVVMGDETDAFAQRLDGIVAQAEAACKPALDADVPS